MGVLQGITEFLPVSSSGHLVLLKNVFGMKEPDLFFDTMVHCGTLLAVLVVLRHDIKALAASFFLILKGLLATPHETIRLRNNPQGVLIVFIIIACIPTALIGFLFKGFVERLFSSVFAVGVSLAVTGTLLLITRFAHYDLRSKKGMRWTDAFVIGCAQAVAIAPGISRSGSTIATALLLGIDREMAGRFSFLIFIPAILGAIMVNVELPESHALAYLSTMAAATVAASLTGYAALKLLLRFVRQGKLYVFAPYCYCLGAVAMAFSF